MTTSYNFLVRRRFIAVSELVLPAGALGAHHRGVTIPRPGSMGSKMYPLGGCFRDDQLPAPRSTPGMAMDIPQLSIFLAQCHDVSAVALEVAPASAGLGIVTFQLVQNVWRSPCPWLVNDLAIPNPKISSKIMLLFCQRLISLDQMLSSRNPTEINDRNTESFARHSSHLNSPSLRQSTHHARVWLPNGKDWLNAFGQAIWQFLDLG